MSLGQVRHDPLAAHRGPFRLEVTRVSTKRPGHYSTEWLKTSLRGSADDIRSEVFALLTDPRDAILSIGLYSETEGQFVTVYRKGDEARNWSPITNDFVAEHHAPAPDVDQEAVRFVTDPATTIDQPDAPAVAPARQVAPAGDVSRKTCGYSGTKGLAEGQPIVCPSCGITRSPHKENRGKGKFGPVIYPYHKAKETK